MCIPHWVLPTRCLKVVTQVLEGLGTSGEAIMRNKHNKLQLSKVLSTYNFGERVTVESQSDGVFSHEEADITMISYLLMAAESDTPVIRILSDDTDVFVLLLYWVYRQKFQATVLHGGMEQYGTSMLPVQNSAPNACRSWGCTISLAQIPPHTCTARGKCQPLTP